VCPLVKTASFVSESIPSSVFPRRALKAVEQALGAFVALGEEEIVADIKLCL
jgi:hypothetical protein